MSRLQIGCRCVPGVDEDPMFYSLSLAICCRNCGMEIFSLNHEHEHEHPLNAIQKTPNLIKVYDTSINNLYMLYYSQEYLPVSVSSFNIGNRHILVKSNDNFIHTLNRYIIQDFVKMNGVDTGTQSTLLYWTA